MELARGIRMADFFVDYITHLKSLEKDEAEYSPREYETTSYKAQTRINANLKPFFGGLKPEQVTSDLLTQYKTKRTRQGVTPTTINNEFRIVRAALNRGTKTTPRKVNPLHVPDFGPVINEKAEKNAAKTGTITLDQYHLILGHLAEHMKSVFTAVYFTGVRSKEIKFVRRDQVNFAKHTIALTAGETKEGDPRVCTMNDHAQEVLLAWEKQTKADYPTTKWFFHFKGEQIGNWKTAWNAALKRCKLRIKDKATKKWKNLVRFHDTRRTMITGLDDIGIEEKDIQTQSGHKTTRMSRRYNQSSAALERIRTAQNQMLGLAKKPAASAGSDWKAEPKELKGMLDDGTLTADEFAKLKQRLMA